MENSYLVVILKTLTKKEVRELRKWLHSPFHNQREDVIGLFEYLFTGAHLENDKFLQKERVFSKIFPNESYDDGKLRQTIHFLLKTVEEFLIYQELREDEVRSRMSLASVYRKRKLEKAFHKTMRGVEQIQEQNPYRDEQFLRNEYLLQRERYSFFAEWKRNVKMNLQEVSDALDMTYCADKLRQSCLMLAHQRVYKTEYDIGLIEQVLNHVESKGFLNFPTIAVYYHGYKLFTNAHDEENFFHLKAATQKHGAHFTSSELRDIFLMAINYCVAKINAGVEKFIREAFDLYKQGFEEEVLIENKTISRWTFNNVVAMGLKLGEFNWVRAFIYDYQNYLHPQFREDIVNYCMAKLHYEKKEYQEAMPLLARMDSDDVLITILAKTTLLQIYYEETEFDALESLLDSLRTYLTRKKMLSYHKENFSNFIKYTRKLVRINPFEKSERQKLFQEITQANPMTTNDRNWLLAKLQDL